MNHDLKTIEGFGAEWERFDQSALSETERENLFQKYFGIFPWDDLPTNPKGFDLGCGSGRWATLVAPRILSTGGELHCIDPAEKALNVARKALYSFSNVCFHQATVDQIPLNEASMDFGYSLGVLHHVPDTFEGLSACTAKLKPGAPFLLYLYYALENRPLWFRVIFKVSNVVRLLISKLPQKMKNAVCQVIAAGVYYPLARGALLLKKCAMNIKNIPLSFYHDKSFFVMQTDALDRFGTPLEQRFTRVEIKDMMERAHLENTTFSDQEPYWVAVGWKKK